MANQISFADFQKAIKPGMLGPDGRFKSPQAGGGNYQAEGMTPEEFYRFMTTQVEDPMARDGSDGGYRDRGPADASWIEGAQKTGAAGEFWTLLPMALTAGAYGAAGGFGGAGAAEGAGLSTAGGGATGAAADFGAGTYAAGAEGLAANSGMTLAEQYAAYGAGGGGVTGGLSTGTVGGFTGAAGGDLVGTAASGATAMAKGGSTMAEIAAKYGPQVAKMAVAALVSGAANDGGATGGSSSNVDSLVSSAFGNTKSMENDYNTLFKPWAIDQVGKATARGDAGYDALTGLASAPNKNLASYQTYVDRIGSQGYRDQQRGQAMGEVQQQSDIGLGSARRAAMARGVDPSKFALQANASSISTAAAKTKAAADAEGLAWDQFGKGAQTAAGMHIADTSNRANLITGANNLGAQGLNAGTKVATVDGAYRGGLTSGYNSTLGTVTGANNSANNQSNYEREHGLSGIVNAGLATAATKWLTDTGSDAVSNILK